MLEDSSGLAVDVYRGYREASQKHELEILSKLTEAEIELLKTIYTRLTISKGKVLYKPTNTKISAILAEIMNSYTAILAIYTNDEDTKTQLKQILLKFKKPEHKPQKRKVL